MSQRDEFQRERELRDRVSRLPRELRPQRDLWPEIAGQLGAQRGETFAAGWWRLAAAVVLMAGGLLAAMLLRPESPPREISEAMASEGAVPAVAAAHLRQRDGVLHVYNDLVAAVGRRGGRLDDEGAAALASGLMDLEGAVAEIEAALAVSPGDRRLRLALAGAYRRESDWTSRLGRV
jgi:hypothetical protein